MIGVGNSVPGRSRPGAAVPGKADPYLTPPTPPAVTVKASLPLTMLTIGAL